MMLLRPDTTLRRPALARPLAMTLARDEYTRFADAVDALPADAWTRPTACPAWDVRAMTAHVAGMAAMAAGVLESVRQQRLAGRDAAASGTAFIDALTALQVRERADHGPDRLREEVRRLGPRAARGRRMAPGLVRRRDMGIPHEVDGTPESWTVGFLLDVILTRDTWMHRSDIAEATGTAMLLTPEHDGVLVADVVEEWAGRHGRPFELHLDGPAGGSWRRGDGGEVHTLDAVAFCRLVSGRGRGEGLLATQVPF